MFLRRWLGLERASAQVGALRKVVNRSQIKFEHEIAKIHLKLDVDEKIIDLASLDIEGCQLILPPEFDTVNSRARWLNFLVNSKFVTLTGKEIER